MPNRGGSQKEPPYYFCTSIPREPKECRPCLCATSSELHPSAANISRPRSAPTVLALGKLGACVTLPSIDLDSCLHLKILRRHSIGNKERQVEQSCCLRSNTRTTINFIWDILVPRLAAMIGVSAASVNAAGFGIWGVCKWGLHIWTFIFCLAHCESRPVAVVQGKDAMSHARM